MWRCLLMISLLMTAACSRSDNGRTRTASASADTTVIDTAAAGDAAEEDPPCLASKLGLPCR